MLSFLQDYPDQVREERLPVMHWPFPATFLVPFRAGSKADADFQLPPLVAQIQSLASHSALRAVRGSAQVYQNMLA